MTSLGINIWSGQRKPPTVSPFLAPFLTRSPTLTFNQGKKRLLLPPSGPLYFSLLEIRNFKRMPKDLEPLKRTRGRGFP